MFYCDYVLSTVNPKSDHLHRFDSKKILAVLTDMDGCSAGR